MTGKPKLPEEARSIMERMVKTPPTPHKAPAETPEPVKPYSKKVVKRVVPKRKTPPG